MELFVLLCIIIIFFIFIYKHKKDLLCPSIVITIGYILTSLCGLYNYKKWQSNISFIVILSVILGLVSFYFGDLLIEQMYKKKTNSFVHNKLCFSNQLKKLFINPFNLNVFLAIVLSSISTYLVIKDVIRIAYLNYRKWGNLIYNFRHNLEISKIAALPRLGNLLTTGIAFVYIFIFLNNLFSSGKIKGKSILRNIVFLIPAILYSVQIVFLGGRIGVLISILAFAVIASILRYYYYGKKVKININLLLMALLFSFIFGSFFFNIQEFVGRDQESEGSLDYVTTYLGASLELFSQYVEDPFINTDDIETLKGIVDNGQRYLHVFKEVPIESTLEFRQSASGIELGNVYTGFRNYYNDLGIAGVILFGFILGFIFNAMYYSLLCFRHLNYRRLVLLLFYAASFYCIAFHFFTDYFFIGISINMLIKVLFIFATCVCVFKEKLKF